VKVSHAATASKTSDGRVSETPVSDSVSDRLVDVDLVTVKLHNLHGATQQHRLLPQPGSYADDLWWTSAPAAAGCSQWRDCPVVPPGPCNRSPTLPTRPPAPARQAGLIPPAARGVESKTVAVSRNRARLELPAPATTSSHGRLVGARAAGLLRRELHRPPAPDTGTAPVPAPPADDETRRLGRPRWPLMCLRRALPHPWVSIRFPSPCRCHGRSGWAAPGRGRPKQVGVAGTRPPVAAVH